MAFSKALQSSSKWQSAKVGGQSSENLGTQIILLTALRTLSSGEQLSKALTKFSEVLQTS